MKNMTSITVLVLSVLFCSCGQINSSSSKNNSALSNAIIIRVGNAPGCIEVADLNNDKLPDLVVTNEQDSSATILLGKGNAQFEEASGSPFPAGHNVNDVAI